MKNTKKKKPKDNYKSPQTVYGKTKMDFELVINILSLPIAEFRTGKRNRQKVPSKFLNK